MGLGDESDDEGVGDTEAEDADYGGTGAAAPAAALDEEDDDEFDVDLR